ncbi:MAG: HAD family hydrolase [Gaiellaceae bacterium]
MKSLPDALLLDLDGVVADTEAISLQAFKDTYAERGVPLAESDLEAIAGLSFDRAERLLRERHTVPGSADSIRTDYRRRYVGRLEQGIQPNPGLRELLAAASERQIPVAVASSSPRYQVELVLELTAVAPSIQAIASGSEVPATKPAPDVYLLALERLRRGPQGAVAIEDTATGVAAARAAGVRCVGLRTGTPSTALAGASLTVSSLRELTLERLGEVAWSGTFPEETGD